MAICIDTWLSTVSLADSDLNTTRKFVLDPETTIHALQWALPLGCMQLESHEALSTFWSNWLCMSSGLWYFFVNAFQQLHHVVRDENFGSWISLVYPDGTTWKALLWALVSSVQRVAEATYFSHNFSWSVWKSSLFTLCHSLWSKKIRGSWSLLSGLASISLNFTASKRQTMGLW